MGVYISRYVAFDKAILPYTSNPFNVSISQDLVALTTYPDTDEWFNSMSSHGLEDPYVHLLPNGENQVISHSLDCCAQLPLHMSSPNSPTLHVSPQNSHTPPISHIPPTHIELESTTLSRPSISPTQTHLPSLSTSSDQSSILPSSPISVYQDISNSHLINLLV